MAVLWGTVWQYYSGGYRSIIVALLHSTSPTDLDLALIVSLSVFYLRTARSASTHRQVPESRTRSIQVYSLTAQKDGGEL